MSYSSAKKVILSYMAIGISIQVMKEYYKRGSAGPLQETFSTTACLMILYICFGFGSCLFSFEIAHGVPQHMPISTTLNSTRNPFRIMLQFGSPGRLRFLVLQGDGDGGPPRADCGAAGRAGLHGLLRSYQWKKLARRIPHRNAWRATLAYDPLIRANGTRPS